MFEYVDRRREPATIAFYCAGAPFGLLWVLHPAVWTAFLVQAYTITMLVFVLDPFEMRPLRAKQKGFWKVMLLSGILIHPPLLLGLWYLDSKDPTLVEGTLTLFSVTCLIFAIELVVLGTIVDRLRPSEQVSAGTTLADATSTDSDTRS